MEELAREMESMAPDGSMLDLIMGVDPSTLNPDQLITAYAVLRKIMNHCEWLGMSILNHIPDTTDLAMAIHEPERSLSRLKDVGNEILDSLPAIAALMRTGDLDFRRADAIRERTHNLTDPLLVAEVEEALVDVAAGLNRTQLCRKTTSLVAKADPEGYERRCQKAREDRRVEFRPLPDGMAKLTWILDATQAHQLFQQICADATNLPTDDRTTDQKRCDVLMDRLLGTRDNWNVRTFVTISMETLMGLTNDPGLLAGYGPISADTARALAMHGPWRGLLLDEGGHVTDITAQTYRPPASLKEYGFARTGGNCSAPGCTLPIQEHDHITPWPAGKTETDNLQGLCKWHHRRKHDDHTATRDADGTTRWTTPTGRQYTTHPYQY